MTAAPLPPVAMSRMEASWAKRRPWSRTATARWLNDRSPSVMAWLRLRPGKWPATSNSIGYWLQEHAPAVFGQVHERLLEAGSEAKRDALRVGEVLE